MKTQVSCNRKKKKENDFVNDSNKNQTNSSTINQITFMDSKNKNTIIVVVLETLTTIILKKTF